MEDKQFTEFLKEHIKSKGISWRFASEKLEVPYMTLFQWKQGLFSPPDYVKRLIMKEVEKW